MMTIIDPMLVLASLLFIGPGGILAMFSRTPVELTPAIACGGIGILILSAGIQVTVPL